MSKLKGAKKMAKAKKRTDGRYSVSLVVGHKDGKPIRKSFYSRKSIADARRQRDEWMDTHEYGHDGVPTERLDGGITLSAWAEKWIASYKSNLTPNTRDYYKNQTNAICDYIADGVRFGDMPMCAFKPIHISTYLSTLSGKSKSTIRGRKMTLQQLFTTARQNGIIERDICADLAETAHTVRVKGTYDGHRALSRDWINIINDNWNKHRFGLYAILAIWTGMRPAELCALQWKDVDKDANVLHVRRSLDIRHGSVEKDTKTECGVRNIPMFATVRHALFSGAARHTSEYICARPNGMPYGYESLSDAWDSFRGFLERIANGVPHPESAQGFRKDKWIARLSEQKKEWITFDYTLYDLRTTFCTTLYDAGVDIKTAQKYMGHKDASTTLRIYTKLSDERENDSASAVDAFIGKTYAFKAI